MHEVGANDGGPVAQFGPFSVAGIAQHGQQQATVRTELDLSVRLFHPGLGDPLRYQCACLILVERQVDGLVIHRHAQADLLCSIRLEAYRSSDPSVLDRQVSATHRMKHPYLRLDTVERVTAHFFGGGRDDPSSFTTLRALGLGYRGSCRLEHVIALVALIRKRPLPVATEQRLHHGLHSSDEVHMTCYRTATTAKLGQLLSPPQVRQPVSPSCCLIGRPHATSYCRQLPT